VEDTLLLHWNGTTWSKVPTPEPRPASQRPERRDRRVTHERLGDR
jgi:hypothetical protein